MSPRNMLLEYKMAASLLKKVGSHLPSSIISTFYMTLTSCCRNSSILKSSRNPLVAICPNFFHTTVPAHEGKYHNLKKKRKLRRNRNAMLRSRYERLVEEERPTGCLLCPKRGDVDINYKNVRLLSQFVSPHTGRIYPRAITGLCLTKQKEIAKAIRRSQSMGFMPFTMKYFEFHNDPKVF